MDDMGTALVDITPKGSTNDTYLEISLLIWCRGV